MPRGSVPGERRGGRQAGTPNRTTTALREAVEELGGDPALALIRIAKSAEENGDLGLAVEAYGKVVGFIHARPKPVDVNPEALIELERALIRVKLEETAKAVKSDDTLADRLARAKQRHLASEVFQVFDAMTATATEAATVIDAQPVVSQPVARPTMHEPTAALDVRAAPAPAAYTPILPRLLPSADWNAPASAPALFPQRQSFADAEYSPLEAPPHTGGLVGSRNS